MDPSEARLASSGSNGASPPLLPIASSNLSVIFERASLLPLAFYLASSRLPYQLLGQTVLTTFICVGLFPRLGVLGGIADFLQQGTDFLDRAASISGLHQTVWDVIYGSVFPCANGAANEILATYVLRHVDIKNVPEDVPAPDPDSDSRMETRSSESQDHQNTVASPSPASVTASSVSVSEHDFRRYQTLHILNCSGPENHRSEKPAKLGSFVLGFVFEVVILLGLLGACTVTALFGLYGTTVAILITVLFRISRQLIHVARPIGYLYNNEKKQRTAYMLLASHENASAWYLYRGSRSVIDWLLNKAMIESITSPWITSIWLAHSLRLLQIVQIITMTYVAAQKGWDGVALLSLVVVAWAFDSIAYSDDKMTALWLRRESVTIEAQSFKFSGRVPMIGAIQVLSKSTTISWMDGIIAPSTRRDAWLSELGFLNVAETALSEDDRTWVHLHKELTAMAVEKINEVKANDPNV